MAAILDFDLKRALPFLTKDHRLDVLTTLMLHANIRNRCWPSMETITELATNGNRNKASIAKQWLEKHCAFELVPYSKRVAEELKLQPRQHIYQLLGTIHACTDETCDCGHDGQVYRYLYFGKSIDGHTIENMNGDTFESIDGHTGSISIEVEPKEESPNGKMEDLIKAWLDTAKVIKPSAYKNTTIRGEATGLFQAHITTQDVTDYVTELLTKPFYQTKGVTFSDIATGIVTWKEHRTANGHGTDNLVSQWDTDNEPIQQGVDYT